MRDEAELAVVELCDRAPVIGRVGDDLLALECGIEVREDANLPVATGRKPERLGWRLVLAAGAERAARELVGVRRRLEVRERPRPERAPGRDDDRSA